MVIAAVFTHSKLRSTTTNKFVVSLASWSRDQLQFDVTYTRSRGEDSVVTSLGPPDPTSLSCHWPRCHVVSCSVKSHTVTWWGFFDVTGDPPTTSSSCHWPHGHMPSCSETSHAYVISVQYDVTHGHVVGIPWWRHRDPRHKFVVSLAVADLMVGVIVLPFSSANQVRKLHQRSPHCTPTLPSARRIHPVI